jgi:peptidoglycan-associated lipoprotein
MRKLYPVVCVVCFWFAGCRPPVHIALDPGPIVPPSNGARVIPVEDQSESGRDLIAKTPVVTDPTHIEAVSSGQVIDLPHVELKDAFFAYNRHDLVPDARTTLDQDATALKSIFQDFPGIVLTVEGHCDERGSAEYNLALGDLRARTARDFLVELGVAERQLEVVSYGKERPQCAEPEPSCWQKNRRAHITKK